MRTFAALARGANARKCNAEIRKIYTLKSKSPFPASHYLDGIMFGGIPNDDEETLNLNRAFSPDGVL